MVFAGPSSPASTDSESDTEGGGKAGFCPIFPRMVSAGPFSPAGTDSGTKTGGMEGKQVLKLGLNCDQLRRKAMRGLSAYFSGTLAKKPKEKEDASAAGSENGKSPAAGAGGGMDEAPAAAIADEVTTHNPKVYTLAELKSATGNFRPDTMLGEGGFGRVFKGWVDERTLAPSEVGHGIPVAVKKSNPDSAQGLCEWQSEIWFLGELSHPNLVRLPGYCLEDNQYLLVYEYMQRGSLENNLFRRGAEPLPWDVRLKIAIGAARGVDYMHKRNVIYRDLKSSNILLDADYNAKLSDFGLAKLGPAGGNSHVTTRVIGTYGYAAPEYVTTGHLYVKSDVYGFGVVLLEMLTGLQALDPERPSGQQNLVEWARPSLRNKGKLRKIMDERLEGQYPLKAATQAAELILKCLEGDPKARPSMDEVLVALEHINTIRERKKEAKASPSSRPSSHQHHHNHPSIANSPQSQFTIDTIVQCHFPIFEETLAKNPEVKGDVSAAAGSGGGMDEAPAAAKAGKVITHNLKMYTLAELKSATRNFRPDQMLGEGGFGRVFKGWVDERTLAPYKVGRGIPVAIKKSNPDSDQGLREWQSEVKFLGKFSHPNLVRLLGFCLEDDQYLLVYEYMQRGSLENHLFRRVAEPLPWDVRLKIAIGAARGVDFLHKMNVIYRDFKSSNILLDADNNAKLSDFGLAKLGPAGGNSHVTTRVMGTYGYAAPEYIATGHLYVKSDVYGFGVVLLEMLTGLQAVDQKRPNGQQNLVEWARPSLHNKGKLRKIMDERLEGQYPLKAATQAAELILKCLEGDLKARPSMDEVLVALEHINTIRERKEAKASALCRPSSHQHHHKQPSIANSLQSQC